MTTKELTDAFNNMCDTINEMMKKIDELDDFVHSLNIDYMTLKEELRVMSVDNATFKMQLDMLKRWRG